jgi:hypothetical protein
MTEEGGPRVEDGTRPTAVTPNAWSGAGYGTRYTDRTVLRGCTVYSDTRPVMLRFVLR